MGRTKIGEDKVLEKGDHIYIILTEPIIFEHHGIYIGDGKVIHFGNMIVESSLMKFAHGLVVRKVKSNYSYASFPKFPMFKTKVKKRYSK